MIFGEYLKINSDHYLQVLKSTGMEIQTAWRFRFDYNKLDTGGPHSVFP